MVEDAWTTCDSQSVNQSKSNQSTGQTSIKPSNTSKSPKQSTSGPRHDSLGFANPYRRSNKKIRWLTSFCRFINREEWFLQVQVVRSALLWRSEVPSRAHVLLVVVEATIPLLVLVHIFLRSDTNRLPPSLLNIRVSRTTPSHCITIGSR